MSKVKLNDLPDIPFKKIISFLPLKDLIKLRAVSRRRIKTIDGFRTKSLYYSRNSTYFTFDVGRFISNAQFDPNFVDSPKFLLFSRTFCKSILSNLKHLYLHYVGLVLLEDKEALSGALNSFSQLEELALFSVTILGLDLNLPMLKSARFENMTGLKKLRLNVPKLQKVKFVRCNLSLDGYENPLRLGIVDASSVERLTTDCLQKTEMEKFKSLRVLYYHHPSDSIDSTLLSGLEQLKEILLANDKDRVSNFFKQKQRYYRTDLKIFINGLPLDGPNDPMISILADSIPLFKFLYYSTFEGFAPELAIDILNRLTDLQCICVDRPVQDIERFLDLLKNLNHILELTFWCN